MRGLPKKLEFKIVILVGALMLVGVTSAGIMVLTIEKSSLYGITETGLRRTSAVIVNDIRRTMLEGRADLTGVIAREIETVSGVEEIVVLNHEGRRAFDKSAPPLEAATMRQIEEGKTAITRRGDKLLTVYEPLFNLSQCQSCHRGAPPVLGAVKVKLSIAKDYDHSMNLILLVILATLFACVCFSLVLWAAIRRLVIVPIQKLEHAAVRLSEGDLSFDVDIASRDEIGRLSRAVKVSLVSISSILKKIKEGAWRVTQVAGEVEQDSRRVVDAAAVESEAVADISASVEEMNAAISDIAEGTEGLAASAEETSASMDQLVSSIAQISNGTGDLTQEVEGTSASISQLSVTIRELADNATALMDAAGRTQRAIADISSSVKEVEQRAKESAVLSDRVRSDAATTGMAAIESTVQGMRKIKLSVEKTAGYIVKLSGRSEEIGQILHVIEDITEQTTLLALNASILAAQAGEHGKGFSVVADEIKDLASRTSVSTQEISGLIQSVRQELDDAVTAMNEGLHAVDAGFAVAGGAAAALGKIVESAKQSSEMSAAIERSTSSQAGSSRLVAEAMDQVLSMVRQMTRITAEQASGVKLIMQATEKMRTVAVQVRSATSEQTVNSRQVSQASDVVSDRSQQILRAIQEQKLGSDQIRGSIEKIKELPRRNRDMAFAVNQKVRNLLNDAELTVTELARLTLAEGLPTGVLRMGVVPLESPAVMFKRFSPLVEYLGARLNQKIDLKVAADFQGAIRDLGQNVTQFSFMTPSTYVEAHAKYGVQVIVKALRDGKPFHHAVLIAKADSPVERVEDIRGRSFAFGDPFSTSSHIVPRAMLLEAGIELKDLQYYNFLGHHDDVAKAVLEGDFDAGAVMEATADRFRDRGLRIVKVSEEIPEFNICITKDLTSETAEDLRTAMTSLVESDSQGASVLKAINDQYTGFVGATHEDFRDVEFMMAKIGML